MTQQKAMEKRAATVDRERFLDLAKRVQGDLRRAGITAKLAVIQKSIAGGLGFSSTNAALAILPEREAKPAAANSWDYAVLFLAARRKPEEQLTIVGSVPALVGPEEVTAMVAVDRRLNADQRNDYLKEVLGPVMTGLDFTCLDHRAGDDLYLVRGERRGEESLSALMPADTPCVKVEYDPRFQGGDYDQVGSFAYVPAPICDVLDVPAAFVAHTGLAACNIIHWSGDEQFRPDGSEADDAEAAETPYIVRATVTSDDGVACAAFDAAPWCEQADLATVEELLARGGGRCEESDLVALWAEQAYRSTAEVFDHLSRINGAGGEAGYSCQVNTDDLRAWLAARRRRPAPSIPAVPAKCYSDDQVHDVRFDAAPWLLQASDQEIQDLIDCGCGGDYPADTVAWWFEDKNDEIGALFSYLHSIRRLRSKKDQCGFECHVDEQALGEWLRMNRPALLEAKRNWETLGVSRYGKDVAVVTCINCSEEAPAATAHNTDAGWVCDGKCWDERLR